MHVRILISGEEAKILLNPFRNDSRGSRRGLVVLLRIGSFVSSCNSGGGVEFVLRPLLAAVITIVLYFNSIFYKKNTVRLGLHSKKKFQKSFYLPSHAGLRKIVLDLGGILFFAPLYVVSLRFALFYFGLSFLPLFTLPINNLPSYRPGPHVKTKTPMLDPD
jgi:hypothetical protein